MVRSSPNCNTMHVRNGADTGSSKRPKDAVRQATETLLSIFGVVLLSYSCYSMFNVILHSVFFHGILGFVLVMNFSPQVRLAILNHLPQTLNNYLYHTSLLDIAIDMSKLVHSFAALGATSLLRRDELYELAHALPPDYAYLHQPGLVHMLPAAVRNMLLLEQAQVPVPIAVGETGLLRVAVEEREDHRHDREGEGGEEEGDGFFTFRGVPVPAAQLPTPVRRLFADADAGATMRVMGRPNPMQRPPRANARGGNFSSFEHAVRRLSARYMSIWVQHAHSMVAMSARYVVTGGSCTDLQLLGATVGLGAVGVTCSTLVTRRTVQGLRTANIGLVSQALSIAVPICLGIASTAGGMLVVRTLDREGLFSAIYAAGVSASPLRVLLTSAKTRLRSFWRDVRGMEGQALCVAVSLSTLLVLLSWRLRSRFRQWGWIMAVVMQRLRNGCADAWQLIMSA